MFARINRTKNKDGTVREYLQIAESMRVEGKKYPQARILCTLGRLDHLQNGQADALIAGLQRFCQGLNADSLPDEAELISTTSIGQRLVVEKLWNTMNMPDILSKLNISGTHASVIFNMVLARMDHPASKRATQFSAQETLFPEETNPSLNTYYRALDELMPNIAAIEDGLYAVGNGDSEQFDMFKDLEIVFFDTTSVSIDAAYSDDLFFRGYSKDNRPDLPQFIVGLVVTTSGEPLCHYVFPGNTADINAFKHAFNNVRARFPVKRTILVADRGCISADVIDEITSHGMEYILASRLRTDKVVQKYVLTQKGNYSKYDSDLSFKDIIHENTRYLLVRNKLVAKIDADNRESLLESLRKREGKPLKDLAGNAGFKRFLKPTGRIEIDGAKIKAEAKFDGKWVLRTNVKDFAPSDLIEGYKTLYEVEAWFRVLKADLKVAPVFHYTADRVKAHVMICFLAMRAWARFLRRLHAIEPLASPRDTWRRLAGFRSADVRFSGKCFRLRPEPDSAVTLAFRAVGAALPKKCQQL